MWRILAIGMLLSGFLETTLAATPIVATDPEVHEKPEWFKNSFLDIREDVSEAADEGRRVLLYFYQDGCPYCAKLLRENLSQREIVEKTRAGFDVIAINMWGDREVVDFDGNDTTEKAFAANLRVMFTPTLLFLDEGGKVALRVNGYYAPHKFTAALDYVAGHHEKNQSFRQFYTDTGVVAASGKLHRRDADLQPPFDLRAGARAGDRPLLVLFEQKQCPACDEMHLEFLNREESLDLMKQFDVVLLDMWAKDAVTTPAGEQTTTAAWADKLDIKYAPSLLFFDSEGNEVFRAEAYLKSFHIQSLLEYISTGIYKTEPEFQRYVQQRADHLREQGIPVDIMN